MNEETKRKKIQKYFKGFAGGTIVALVLGIICIVIGIAAEWEILAIIGILPTVGGIIGIIVSLSGRPTDAQVDDWLESDRQMLITRSKAKLGVDESQIVSDPYELFIWLWESVPRYGIPAEDVKTKRGKLQCQYPHFYYSLIRHSAWRFQVFYPAEHYLASYGCAFDFLRGKFVHETTAEIYYKDITLLATQSQDSIDASGIKESEYETFTLKVSSGDAISVTIPSEYLINQLLQDSLSEVPSTRCGIMVQSMRKMIEAKKIS